MSISAPQISVLMPFRNAAATVEEAARGVLCDADSLAPSAVELVALDDGSTDAGPQLMHQLANCDNRVRIINTGGVGIPRALTVGLSQTNAEFVARMDADDVTLPGRFSQQLRRFESAPKMAVVGTQVEGFADGDNAAIGLGLRRYIDWQNALVTPEQHAMSRFVESPLCHPSVMIRRSALVELGGYRDFAGPEDYELWLRFVAAEYQLCKVPRILLRWRHQAGRATFSDERYSRTRFLQTKAPYLADTIKKSGRALAVWGAGQAGKRTARALEPFGVCASFFVDIDPQKIGRTARSVPIVVPDDLVAAAQFLVVAVAARGARSQVCDWLDARGFEQGVDYICAC